MERYEHLKKVFKLREQYEAKMAEEKRRKLEEATRVARKADLLSGDGPAVLKEEDSPTDRSRQAAAV